MSLSALVRGAMPGAHDESSISSGPVHGVPLRPHASAPTLSPRELEIVQLVAEDLTNAEIAERLIISPRTVTTHLDRIYTRLGINSRTALVRYAIEASLLPPKH